jgi:hypothetical protein
MARTTYSLRFLVFSTAFAVAAASSSDKKNKSEKNLATGDDDHSTDSEYVSEWHYIYLICHFASLLEAVAFLQPTMIRLRVFETAGAGLIAVYSIIHSHNLLDCHFLWGSLHFLINGSKVMVYLRRKYAGRLLREEESALNMMSCTDTEFGAQRKQVKLLLKRVCESID